MLFKPRMKCANGDLTHTLFLQCPVEFIQHTMFALILILRVIWVRGAYGVKLWIEVKSCTKATFFTSIWGGVAIDKFSKSLLHVLTFSMIGPFPSITMTLEIISAGNHGSIWL